ncbi:hypothetical protein FF1_043339 [Malus domestica]
MRVAASKEVDVIWLFFSTLGSIVNVITTYPKRHTQLQEIMGITDILCRELQNKSQDILNAMNLVTTTKDVL